MHGFFNQLALRSKYDDQIYNPLHNTGIGKLSKSKLEIKLQPGKDNLLTELSKLVIYINHSRISGKDIISCLINVNKSMLDAMYLINKDYFGKEVLEI